MSFYILLENGDRLLTEDEANLLVQEADVAVANYILAENGDRLLTEDGLDLLVLESAVADVAARQKRLWNEPRPSALYTRGKLPLGA